MKKLMTVLVLTLLTQAPALSGAKMLQDPCPGCRTPMSLSQTL